MQCKFRMAQKGQHKKAGGGGGGGGGGSVKGVKGLGVEAGVGLSIDTSTRHTSICQYLHSHLRHILTSVQADVLIIYLTSCQIYMLCASWDLMSTNRAQPTDRICTKMFVTMHAYVCSLHLKNFLLQIVQFISTALSISDDDSRASSTCEVRQ